MRNFEIAGIFLKISELLEIKGESVFKVRAYKKAAESIAGLKVELKDLVEMGYSLNEIEGIGHAIEGKIKEILTTGTCEFYERLKREIPEGLLEMLKIPGLGAKKVKTIYSELNIDSIEELEKAAKEKKLRSLKGFGVKTEQAVLKGISMLKGSFGKILLSTAQYLTEELREFVKSSNLNIKMEFAGEIRRRVELIEKIIAIVACSEKDKKEVVSVLLKFPRISKILKVDEDKIEVFLDLGVLLEVRIVEEKSFFTSLFVNTGSEKHLAQLNKIAESQGLQIAENLIIIKGENYYPNSEEEIYQKIGIPYIIPELREGRGEVEKALENDLPEVISLKDIKGDLHMHTDWSDGINTIEEMAKKAMDLGYEYIAITDHSKSLKIANGLSVERLKEQIYYIKNLNEKFNNFDILTGIEVDILSDEVLDFDDEVLKDLDIVVASIHTGFKQDREKLTRRILKAMENPYVKIIGHPTGRLLGKREGYEIDIDRIIEKALETKTALEINSSPDRLDLTDVYAKKAKEKGVKIVINTDAHESGALEDIKNGIFVARRAWLEKKDVLNTRSLKELLMELKKA
ncbi:MAG: DNA polymerase/3'-5' exonuclease PolX [Thermovenabulum sp.]|uniref:DNA polymerase/3'-5' exonuclease PolX n=1 Tax=Thermovenabulum sp. TaxID=3100335 RepID=UPI003C7CBE8B